VSASITLELGGGEDARMPPYDADALDRVIGEEAAAFWWDSRVVARRGTVVVAVLMLALALWHGCCVVDKAADQRRWDSVRRRVAQGASFPPAGSAGVRCGQAASRNSAAHPGGRVRPGWRGRLVEGPGIQEQTGHSNGILKTRTCLNHPS
jgi:hypothetical protein